MSGKAKTGNEANRAFAKRCNNHPNSDSSHSLVAKPKEANANEAKRPCAKRCNNHKNSDSSHSYNLVAKPKQAMRPTGPVQKDAQPPQFRLCFI